MKKNLFDIRVTVKESNMDVGDDEANNEDCHSDSKHVQGPLLRIGSNPISIQDKILTNGS